MESYKKAQVVAFVFRQVVAVKSDEGGYFGGVCTRCSTVSSLQDALQSVDSAKRDSRRSKVGRFGLGAASICQCGSVATAAVMYSNRFHASLLHPRRFDSAATPSFPMNHSEE